MKKIRVKYWWIVVVFLIFWYGRFISYTAEQRCMRGAIKASETHTLSDEMFEWCKETF